MQIQLSRSSYEPGSPWSPLRDMPLCFSQALLETVWSRLLIQLPFDPVHLSYHAPAIFRTFLEKLWASSPALSAAYAVIPFYCHDGHKISHFMKRVLNVNKLPFPWSTSNINLASDTKICRCFPLASKHISWIVAIRNLSKYVVEICRMKAGT